MSGNRPSPLKINRDSYLIHKQQPSSFSRTAATHGYHQQQQRHQHPVIIYTESPKVIHTRPHDFMALVQKLTGLSSSDQDHVVKEDQTHSEAAHKTLHAGQVVEDHKDDSNLIDRSINDNETSSGVTDEISGGDHRDHENINVGGDDVRGDSSSSAGPNHAFSGFSPVVLQQQNHHQHPYFADIPMFTPTSTDHHHFLCSPRPLYRFSDSSSPSTLCGSISPSMFKFIKGLPEY